MPANLPPQYLKVEDEFRKASTPEKRLEALRELFRLLPKHKGTEKLQSDLKQKMSQLREELERGKSGAKKTGLSHRVPREGAGQIVLIGPPNVGKSTMLAQLTNARPEIAAYPYTTRVPQPGIMMWQDVPVQLVDLPPVAPEFVEPWVPNVIRAADAALLVADLSDDDVADATLAVLERLGETHTELVGELPYDVEDEAIRHLKTVLVATKLDADGCVATVWRWSRSGSRPSSRSLQSRLRPAKDWNHCGRLHTIYWECCGFIPKCLANQPIGPSRSRCRWVARSWTWPGRFIGILSIP